MRCEQVGEHGAPDVHDVAGEARTLGIRLSGRVAARKRSADGEPNFHELFLAQVANLCHKRFDDGARRDSPVAMVVRPACLRPSFRRFDRTDSAGWNAQPPSVSMGTTLELVLGAEHEAVRRQLADFYRFEAELYTRAKPDFWIDCLSEHALSLVFRGARGIVAAATLHCMPSSTGDIWYVDLLGKLPTADAWDAHPDGLARAMLDGVSWVARMYADGPYCSVVTQSLGATYTRAGSGVRLSLADGNSFVVDAGGLRTAEYATPQGTEQGRKACRFWSKMLCSPFCFLDALPHVAIIAYQMSLFGRGADEHCVYMYRRIYLKCEA